MQRQMQPTIDDRSFPRSGRVILRFCFAFFTLLLIGPAEGAEVPVKLIDHVRGVGVPGVRITVHEVLANGARQWAAAQDTDVSGIARLDLKGLSAGRRYILKARPFSRWLESEVIAEAAWYGWHVGKLAIQVVNGKTGAPVAGRQVSLREQSEDGAYYFVENAVTDVGGWVRLDPPQLGEIPVVLRALSPTDGEQKYTAPIHGPGTRRLVLGNDPLVAAVLDGVSNAGLPNVTVEALERIESGELALRATRRTGEDGRAAFDLDGLGQGRTYVLRAEPFGHRVQSQDIGLAGEHQLLAGTMQIALINGANGNPYRRQPVTLFEVLADGARQHVRNLESDGLGLVYLEPDALGERHYQLRAYSPVDGRAKFSEVYTAAGRYAFSVGGPALTVKLVDHVSGTGLAGVRIVAEEVLADGTRQWAAAFDSDAEGKARFDLDGLGEGRRYVLKAQPYQHWVFSDEITDTGWFGWRVGRVAVQVVHGETGAPMPGEPVTLRERADDGTYPYVTNATTDAEGWVRLDPPQLGDVPLVLRALSPSDGEFKYTGAIWGGGSRSFELGNVPLVAVVIDGVDDTGLADVTVEAFERTETGGLAFRASRRTGTDGRAAFDLDGLGQGQAYVLRTEPFGHRIQSEDIGLAGEHQLRAGTIQVGLVSGESGNPYRRQPVVLFEVGADGSREHVRTLESDAEGMLYFEPEALGERRYQLRASSPVDGRAKFSQVYDAPGRYVFSVGGPALTVKLIDHHAGQGMAGQRVIAEEVLSDGSRQWAAAFTTDADGRARFDLDGLGQGRRYVLKAQPFAHWVLSEDITQTGWFGWRVGKLAVRVVNGASGAPMADEKVSLREKADDGSFPYVMSATTDAEGWVRLDPPELGDVPLVLRARSPSDGELKYTGTMLGSGSRTLTIGNAPVIAAVLDGVTGAGVPNVTVEAFEQLDTGSLVQRASRRTAADGRAVFDLDGLGDGRTYVLRAAPFGHRVESDVVGTAGEHALVAGTVQVDLVSGASGLPYRREPAALFEVLADGSRQHVRNLESDGDGLLYLEPEGLGERRYQVRAFSPVDGRAKFSDVYADAGRYVFRVGGPALTVNLFDNAANAGIPGVRIIAEELLPNGAREWAAAFDTDAEGRVRFDLDGLGEGRKYVLKAQPFANWLESDTVTQAGWFPWRVNTLPVTVTDAEGQAVESASVVVFEKSSSGSLSAVMSAPTDQNGQVFLDPAGLGSGATYVVKVIDPLGTGESYFSDLVKYRGEVTVAVAPGATNTPDLAPPQVAIDSAFDGARLGDHGFLVTGTFNDNDRVRGITVRLHGADGVITEVPASLRHGVGQWEAQVPAVSTTVPATVVLRAVAVDRADNLAEVAARIQLVNDDAGPVLEVSSHHDQDTVPDGAFVVQGSAHDDIGAVSLVMRLRNDLGELLDERRVAVAETGGGWSFTAFADEALPSTQIAIELAAEDDAGNETLEVLHLVPSSEPRLERRALGRLTFGATPELVEEVSRIGLDAFIEQQLNPQTIDDSEFLATRALPDDPAQRTLEAALHSRRQLLEVLTVFWANHFNTSLSTHGVDKYENDEHEAFRQHALGRFRDLLGASAKSPAMLRYLDGHSNVAAHPNENYARELLELHTLGDTSRFSESDVTEVARAFTGWTIVDDAFAFQATRHDFDAKHVLGQALPAGQGVEDGEQILDMLARDPSTAANVCLKLTTLFIGEGLPIGLLVNCVQDFLALTDDPRQMAHVLQRLLGAAEFAQSLLEAPMSRTPLEYVLAGLRSLGASLDVARVYSDISRMGMHLHRNAVPTGYSDYGSTWVNSGALQRRLRFLQSFAIGWGKYDDAFADLRGRLLAEGIASADGVAGYLARAAHGADFLRADWQLVQNVLTDDGARTLDLVQPDAEARLRRALLASFAMPQFHLQ